MKTIIFIGTHKSGSSYEALKASESMQYYTVLLTNRKSFIDKRLELPHAHLIEYCDITNVEEAKKVIKSLLESGLDVHAIVSFIEPYCYIASVLAQHFGLKHFSADAIRVMLDKKESRKILDGTGYAPSFYVIGENKKLDLPKPFILKAPRSAGSKDVYKIQTDSQYKEALSELQRKYPDKPILAEEYLDGPQFLVETVTINGKVNVIAVIKQEITFTGRFIVTGYTMMLDLDDEFFQSLNEAVNFIIRKHGLENGPCHLELRYVNNDWKLIEINSRISGGAINLFIETAFGLNLVQETLKLALGLSSNFEYKYKKQTFLQYLIVPRTGTLLKVTGKAKALDCQGVRHVYIRPKKECLITPPVSMSDRYAYVIATGEDAEEARQNARYGASQIKFHLREKCVCRHEKESIENIDSLFKNVILY